MGFWKKMISDDSLSTKIIKEELLPKFSIIPEDNVKTKLDGFDFSNSIYPDNIFSYKKNIKSDKTTIKNKELLLDTSLFNDDSSASKIYEKTFEYELDEKVILLSRELSSSILNDEFEIGYNSKSSYLFSDMMKQSSYLGRKVLTRCFADNFHDNTVVLGLLFILYDTDYDEIYPEGQTIAAATASMNNNQIKEALLRVFESWLNPDSIRILETIKFDKTWLETYRLELIEDIKGIKF